MNNNNDQMIFNPITNQPLNDYKSKQEQMLKEREKEFKELNYLREGNDKMNNINCNKNEQIPMEYNPYKNILQFIKNVRFNFIHEVIYLIPI